MYFKKNYGWKSIILLYLGVSFFRFLFVISEWVDLDAEETQYWLWSKHLDLSYYSKPPLIAYLNKITSFIFGDYPWAVRINAIFYGAIIGLATYHIVLKIYNSKKMAFFISAGLLFLPSYHYISLFFTTDVLVSLFWLLTCYYFWIAIQHNKLKYWIFTGIAMGLGMLSKYAILFFIPFSLFYLLIKKRELLKQKGYYISLAIAFLMFSPVIYWNIKNGMVGMFHVTTLAGSGHDIIHWERLLSRQAELIGGQLLLNVPLLFIIVFWDKYKIKNYLKGDFEQYIIATTIFIYIIFSLVTIIRRVYINWLLFSYIPLYIVLLTTVWRSGLIKEKSVKKYLAITSGLILLLIFQPILNIYAKPVSKIIPAQIDPFRNLVNWEEFATYVYTEMDKQCNGEEYVVLSNRYQVASEFAYYGPNLPATYCYPYKKRRMNQFDLWGIPYNQIKDKKAVFVDNIPMDDDMISKIGSENIIYKTVYSIEYKGVIVRNYYIYLINKMPEFPNAKKVISKF